eukprot:maker-scaffold380_size190731-snap-gene-0.43 protein:Tk02445 transcript:maker-scaffold380_size190731-snap-gene-0.43-mRNA-1 annotation:"aquaporin"
MADFLPYIGIDEAKQVVPLIKSLIAELIGTLMLVLVGCGSCLGGPSADFVRIALAFGVTVATMAQSIGHVSGCHINPAVTAGLFVGRKIGLIKAILYIVFQCLGATVGSGILLALTNDSIRGYGGLGMTTVNPSISAGQAFGIEFLITFILILVVFGAAADDNNAPMVKGSAPLAIGLSITTCHLFAIPFTGSSMNPARTFGPALILGNWNHHWVYWLGPILGGICAALIYQLVLRAPRYAPVSKVDMSGP